MVLHCFVKVYLLVTIFDFGSLEDHDEAIQFGFMDFTAPLPWDTAIDFCNGTRQSPISLKDKYCSWRSMQPLTFSGHWDYRPEGIELRNTGQSVLFHTIGANPPIVQGGPLKDTYVLQQMHFHWGEDLQGSEHEINGKYFGLEAHLVHFNMKYGDVMEAIKHKDGIAVVAIMFDAMQMDNPELSSIVSGLRSVQESNSFEIISGDTLMWLQRYLEYPSDYFTYHGSLTTHPCDQVVTWINLRQISVVGVNQIQKFRKLKGNDGFLVKSRRPVQPRNDRTILCSFTSRSH